MSNKKNCTKCVSEQDRLNNRLLKIAGDYGDKLKTFKKLVERGADPFYYWDQWNQSPLDLAAFARNRKIVKFLLKLYVEDKNYIESEKNHLSNALDCAYEDTIIIANINNAIIQHQINQVKGTLNEWSDQFYGRQEI